MLITLIVTLVIAGIILWLVNAFLPIDYRFKQIIYFLVVLYVILTILAAFGVNVPILGALLHS